VAVGADVTPAMPARSTPSTSPAPSTPSTPSTPSSRTAERSNAAPHLALGAEGETRAALHLARRGYRIVARNVRCGGVELDLVARKGRLVAFVEVKTRRCHRFGPPEMAVDPRKRARLVRGAAHWLSENGRGGLLRARFDVVACEVGPDASGTDQWQIRHIPGAFDADD